MSNTILRAAWNKFWFPLAVQVLLGVPLATEVAPRGILDFELARTQERAQEILNSWPSYVPVLDLLTDFWFIVAYFDLILVVCTLWVPRRSWPWNKPINGRFATLCAIVAALADVVETSALLWQTCLGTSDKLAATAFWGASIKFGMLVVPISVALLALLVGQNPNNVQSSIAHQSR